MRYEWSDQMRGRWEPLLDRAADISNRPYTPYGGPRVAGLSGDEQSGMGAIRNFVSDPSSYLYGRGVDQLYGTVEGDYLTGNKADPYANSGNRYSGTNPEFNNMLQAGMGDISRTFHDETAGNLARFKGPMRHSSAFEQANTDTEDAFAKRLGQFASGMYSDQYKRSADMEENRLNRGSTAYQNERGRQMGASGLSQNDQNLTLDRGRALMGIGGLQRGIDQAGMDVNYQNFLEGRDWDRNQAQWLTGMYGAAQGGQLPNVQQPGPNGFQQAANWLGLASTGVGLYRSLFPGGFGGFGGTAGPAIDWGLESGL